MKKNIKNILWLVLSTIALVFFIIAIEAIGIEVDWFGEPDAYIRARFTDFLDSYIELVINYGNVITSITAIMSLWISGLIISFIIVIFAIIKLTLGFNGKNKNFSGVIGDSIMLSTIMVATILMIAGSSLVINNYSDSSWEPNRRVSFTHFLMLFIPVLLTPIPMLWDKMKAKKVNNQELLDQNFSQSFESNNTFNKQVLHNSDGKNNLKNILWLGISFITLIFFVIAVDAIGIKIDAVEDSSINFTYLLDDFIKNLNGGDTFSTRVIVSLWISGLILSSIIVILSIVKFALEFNGKNKMFSGIIGDSIMLTSLIIPTILMIAGSSYLIDSVVDTNIFKANEGIAFGHYLMLFMPILLTPIPMLWNKIKVKVKKINNQELHDKKMLG